MAKKKKTSLVAVKPKAKKPKIINIGIDFAEASIDKTRHRGERREVFIQMVIRDPSELRHLVKWCIQAADWMDDDK